MSHERNPAVPVIDEALILTCVEESRRETELQWDTKDDVMGGLSWNPIVLHTMPELSMSFKSLARICNLQTMTALRELRLDNNKFTKIENLDHLVNLTWLDLSFNNISTIEGLSSLTKLSDLALAHNNITRVSGMDALRGLQVLTLGSNNIASTDDVAYLRKFDNLRSVSLVGNPVAQTPDYKQMALAFLPKLQYLDFELVDAKDQRAAAEFDTALTELKEADEARQVAWAEEVRGRERAEKLRASNLEGIASFSETLFHDDEDGARLCVFSGVADLQAGFKDKLSTSVLDTIDRGFASWDQCEAEVLEVKAVMKAACDVNDRDLRTEISRITKLFKTAKRNLEDHDDQSAGPSLYEAALGAAEELRTATNELKKKLLGDSITLNEQCKALVNEFETHYSTLMTRRAELFNQFFRAAEKEEVAYKDSVLAVLQEQAERFEAASKSDDPTELDVFEEETKVLLQDRESLMNAAGSSHDAHMSRLLSTEDDVRSVERARSAALLQSLMKDEETRHRERIAELTALHKHQLQEVEALVAAAKEADE